MKFGTVTHCTKGILEYVHTNVWGPIKTTSIGDNHYFVSFINDYSRRCWVYTMKHKGEVLELFVEWKKNLEKSTGRKIKILRSNNGGESDPFLKLCRDEGIDMHFTVRETPQQNGVAERMNRTLLEKVRCMLSNTGISKSFWAEALAYAFHLINRLPSSAIGIKLLWRFGQKKLLRIMIHYGYLGVQPTIIPREISWTQGREKVCL